MGISFSYIVEIQGNVRTEVGSKYAKAERKAGNVPCVVYGGEAPIHFSAPTLAFRGLVYTAEAKTAKITVGDTTVEAVIQDIQFHPVTDQLMHIDFIHAAAPPGRLKRSGLRCLRGRAGTSCQPVLERGLHGASARRGASTESAEQRVVAD